MQIAEMNFQTRSSLLIDIEAKLQQGKGVGYEKWAKTFNLKESGQQFDILSDKIKAVEKRLSKITSMQKHIGTYRKTRDIYMQYRQSGYSKKFLAAHETDILLHKAAKQEFDKFGLEKLPSMEITNRLGRKWWICRWRSTILIGF